MNGRGSKGLVSHPKRSRSYTFELRLDDDIPALSGYVKGIREYSAIDERVRKSLGSKGFVEPIVLWLNEIGYSLVDAKEQIQRAIDRDDYTDIRERMAIEGQSFSEVVSRKPCFPSFSGATDQDELIIEQVIDYFEDLCDRIEHELMDVYYYLIGSKS